jgi:hypothetical protein
MRFIGTVCLHQKSEAASSEIAARYFEGSEGLAACVKGKETGELPVSILALTPTLQHSLALSDRWLEETQHCQANLHRDRQGARLLPHDGDAVEGANQGAVGGAPPAASAAW